MQMPVLGVIPQFTTEEISQIKALISERAKKSKWQQFKASLVGVTTNAFFLLLVGFGLTTLVGTVLTNKYTTQQQEVAAIRSFSDELNKLRIQKVAEVWERLDEDEFMIDDLIQATDKEKALTAEKLNDVIKRLQTDRALVSKYRFWLGKGIFDSANEYLNANIRYILRKLTGSSEEELKAYLEKRNAAKSDIEQVREQFLSARGLPANR
jgi:tetrahydromethanopterin S-methyltransferase subunit B